MSPARSSKKESGAEAAATDEMVPLHAAEGQTAANYGAAAAVESNKTAPPPPPPISMTSSGDAGVSIASASTTTAPHPSRHAAGSGHSQVSYGYGSAHGGFRQSFGGGGSIRGSVRHHSYGRHRSSGKMRFGSIRSSVISGGGDLFSSMRRHRTLIKTQNKSFWQDLKEFRPGSLPHSMVLALTIGTVCGTAAFLYYAGLEFMLEYLWQTLPEQLLVNNDAVPESLYVLWIPIVGFTMALGVGITVRFLGEPGDLPYTIKCVHEKAYVSMDHVLPMVAASQFSILAGGSLGPEAPLVAICAALGGFCSRHVFGIYDRNLVRKHTLMGMAGALAAFFGCPLGGSLFAMEVNSRFGIEYFEHCTEALLCGEVCLAVFRSLAQLPVSPIWQLTPPTQKLLECTGTDVLYGAGLGVAGAATAAAFAQMHWTVLGLFRQADLLPNENAISRALVGAVVVVGLGMCVPHTMFWGEFEIQTIATLSPAETLEHIWPTTGLFGFETNSFGSAMIVGVTKLVAISFTVCGGYRGGYIFPAFAAGCALGRAIYFLLPFVNMQLCVLCMAAALNVALTRTAVSTTLILSYLSGEQNSLTPVLAASLVSLFVTGYMPFIPSQVIRHDLEHAVYKTDQAPVVDDADALASGRSLAGSGTFSFHGWLNQDIDTSRKFLDDDDDPSEAKIRDDDEDDDDLLQTPFSRDGRKEAPPIVPVAAAAAAESSTPADNGGISLTV